ncbi:hypothetical protein HPO96_35510 [Kribbella sandramycini]|nr:hypothetical protein [Kribbella sandramycini]
MADEPVPEQVLLDAIAAAATAPTGTALPWTFAIVTDPGVRREIAERAEVHGAPLVEAPYLLVVFQRRYFADESVGIAVGLLMAALYDAGLGAVVHPVSVMTTLLARMLGRPTSEEAFAVLSVGYPKAETRKADLVPLDEILVRI